MTLNLKNKLKFVMSFKKLFFLNEYLRTKNFESNLIKYNYLQSIILVSRNDINYFSFKRNLNNNNYIPIFESGIGVLPIRINAKEINVNYKKNLGNLLFFGTLSYEPNKVAIDFLLNNLLPILKANKVKFKLTIAGRNPSRNLIKNIEILEEMLFQSFGKEKHFQKYPELS